MHAKKAYGGKEVVCNFNHFDIRHSMTVNFTIRLTFLSLIID